MLDHRPLTDLSQEEKATQIRHLMRKLRRALTYTIDQVMDDLGNFEWSMAHSFTFGMPGVVPIKVEIVPTRDVKNRTVKLSVIVVQAPRDGGAPEAGHPDVSPLAGYKNTLGELFEEFNPLAASTGDDPCPYIVIGPRQPGT